MVGQQPPQQLVREDFIGMSKNQLHKSMKDYDRINDLPDDLLILIISYLSGHELMATSLICHRWRYLWHHVPQLMLDVTTELNQEDFLLNALCRQRGTLQKVYIATECFASYPMSQWGTILNLDREGNSLSDSPKSQSWLQCLREKSVSSLILACNSVSFDFDPYEILSFQSLKELNLIYSYFIFPETLSPVSFGLRSLRLESVHINDDGLETLIGHATNLEHLCLYCCYSLRRPKIHSDILKRLEIQSDVEIFSLDIDAPKLTALKLQKLPELQEVKLRVRALLTLDTTIYLVKQVCIGAEKTLEYGNNANIFRSLLKLSVSISSVNEAESVKWILRNCASLKELWITQENGYSRLNPESTYLGDNETPSCLKNHMKCLRINNFEGMQMEMEFVEYVLSKALALEKLELSGMNTSIADSLERIRSMQKASRDLHIITWERYEYRGPFGARTGTSTRTRLVRRTVYDC